MNYIEDDEETMPWGLLVVILICLLLSSCNMLRKVEKTEIRRDSTAAGVYDSSAVKKWFENNQYSKVTEREIVLPRDTTIVKNYYTTQPYILRERIIEHGQQAKGGTDSVVNKGDTTKTVTVVAEEKKVEQKTSWPVTTWLLLGLVVFVFGKEIIGFAHKSLKK